MVSLRQGLALGRKGVISLVGAGGKTSLMFRLAHELSASGESVLTTTTTKFLRPTAEQSPNLIISDSPVEILQQAQGIFQHSLHVSAASKVLSPIDKLIGFSPETIAVLLRSNIFHWIIVEADGAAKRPLKAPAPHEPVIPKCSHQVIGVLGLSALGRPLDEHTVFRSEMVSNLSGIEKGMDIVEETLCAVLVHPRGIFKGAPIRAKKIAFLNQADNQSKRQAARSIVQMLKRQSDIGISRVVIGSTRMDPGVLEYQDL